MLILLLNISSFSILLSSIFLYKYFNTIKCLFSSISLFLRSLYHSRLDPMIILDLIKHFGELYFPFLRYNWKSHSLIKRGDVYTLKFVEDGNKYSLRFKKNRKPLKIFNVQSSTCKGDVLDTVCVTDEIYEYLGPGRNFYGIPTTPKLLGYDNLKFELTDGTVCIFDQNDIINIELFSS